MFKIINRDSVPRNEFTLDSAVEKVIEFNGIYNPAYIYVDKGFGEYQVEMLKKRGLQAKEVGRSDPAYGLDTKVVGIAFNQHLDVRDPVSKVVERKPVKPFMVNQTVLLLDRDRLIINKNDNMLWRQMENYQVVRVSVDGRPTYTSENEHALDALMLAVLGFTMEFPHITQTIYIPDVTRTMAIAPSVKRSEPNFDPAFIKKDDEEKEEFLTREARERNSQTWFRSKDLRKSRNAVLGPSGFSFGTVRPRGRGSGGKGSLYSRPKI
ncbi:MAG TPA: hypothetical protein VFD33_02970 [Bacillota bacterium]|nr:hypothetical protein [Bacillota bacterium]